MQFTDAAIVLSARKHAETSAIVRVLTAEHGLYAGLVKGISGKAARGVYQAGNVALITWKARLAEQMGMFSAELLEPVAAHAMQDAGALYALSSACTLTEMMVPERAPYVELYAALHRLAQSIKTGADWPRHYALFEHSLLAATGFRLDLSHCAATGSVEELVYVSPKSGRAVCAQAGKPYHTQMLPLPAFLLSGAEGTPAEILASLRLTGYFLEHWVLEPHGKRFPAARGRLVAELGKTK